MSNAESPNITNTTSESEDKSEVCSQGVLTVSSEGETQGQILFRLVAWFKAAIIDGFYMMPKIALSFR